mgnify:CR=1 FL=1
MSENLYWLWLSECCSYKSHVLDRLLRCFHSPRAIYEADEADMLAAAGECSPGERRRLCDKELTRAQRIMDGCMMSGIGILTYGDPAYPKRLRMIDHFPPVLYYRGKLPRFDNRLFISIVGTRRMSEYGKRMAFEIAYDLTRAGVTVVTGMALGVDGTASAAALAAGNGGVAVLGCGVDITYPSQHRHLMESIIRRGVVMSEFPPGSRPDAFHFPQRNRVISGLSQGVLVIEGNENSGALITADFAGLQGRDVFALPGNADEVNSAAPTLLLKQGATPVTCADDIIKVYASLYKKDLNIFRLLKPMNVNMEKVLYDYGVAARPAPHTRAEDIPVGVAQTKISEKVKNKPIRPRQGGYCSLEELGPLAEDPPPSPLPPALKTLNADALAVYQAIPLDRSVSVDEICQSGFSAGTVMAALTMLELNKCVVAEAGGLYSRIAT